MRKALNFIFLWLVLLLAFQAFACKSVQKGAKEEPGEAAVTVSKTNTKETAKPKAVSAATGKKKVSSNGTVKKKASNNETVKAKAVSTETSKSKQGALAELKEEVIEEVKMEAEKILTPTVRKAILPSGVGLLILASLMSSKKDKRKDD
jgi:preprotein translocase subunit SecF